VIISGWLDDPEADAHFRIKAAGKSRGEIKYDSINTSLKHNAFGQQCRATTVRIGGSIANFLCVPEELDSDICDRASRSSVEYVGGNARHSLISD